MRILVLAFYFPPDLGAGSFRMAALVDALCASRPADVHLDVVTTLPNRYQSFTVDASRQEQKANLSILRIALPKHQSGLLDQSLAFVRYAMGTLRHVFVQDYDMVFVTSARLMTAVLGGWIAWRKGIRLYVDFRDIFVNDIAVVLPRGLRWCVKPVLSALEAWVVKRADKVNLISPGFLDYFQTRYPGRMFSCFTHGVDAEFMIRLPVVGPTVAVDPVTRPLTVLYAGNIGAGQGLHLILPELARRVAPGVCFKIIGDGGRKRALLSALSKAGVTNVEWLPPVNRERLLVAYRAADVLFLHLNHCDAFGAVLPSKLFEYAALGKPVWAGLFGYSAEFVRSEISNAALFHPGDVEGAVQAFKTLKMQDVLRTDFMVKYSRETICREMAADVLDLVCCPE